MGMRKVMETMFAIGGKLDPSFKNAVGHAQIELARAYKKGGDAAALTNAQKQISASMKNIGKAANKMGAAWGNVATSIIGPLKTIGMLGAASGAAVYGLATATAKLGSNAVTAAKKIGITTQEYSKLAYAAGQSSVSQEILSSSMKKLNLNTAAAAKGNKEAQLAFKRVGVNIYDTGGKLKSTNEIMLEASNMFAKMPEGIYKADLAMALFGKSGADMVPLMEKGSKEIERLSGEAERLGIVFSDDEGMNASGFMDSLSNIKSAMQGLGITVGKQLYEPLTKVNTVFTEWLIANREAIGLKVAEMIEEFKNHLPAIQEFLINAKESVVSFATSVNNVAQAMGGWGNVIKGVAMAWGAFKIINIAIALGSAIKATMAFIGAVKTGIAVVGAVVSHFGVIVTVFKVVGAAILGISAPVAIAIGVIAALIAIGVAIYKNWDWIKSTGKAIWNAIANFVSDTIDIIVGSFNNMIYGFSKAWGIVKDIGKQTWDALASFIGAKIDSIKALLSSIGDFFFDLLNEVVSFFSDKIDSVKAMFDEGFVKGITQLLKQFNFWSLINDMIKKVFDIDLIGMGKDFIGRFISGITSGAASAGNVVKNAVGGLLSNIPGVGKFFGDTKKVAEKIPAHGYGGFITSPHIAMVGEDGPEVILPLSKPNRMRELLSQISPRPAETLSSAVNSNSGASIGGASFNFAPVINVSGGDAAGIETSVSNALEKARNYFEKWMNEYQRNNARVAIA